MEDREKQFLTTLGAWAHMKNQKRNTAELQKQNKLLAEQATAEAERTKIEEKRLQLEIEHRKIDEELKAMEKKVRKEMVVLSQAIERVKSSLDIIVKDQSSYSGITYDLGILTVQLEAIKEHDILSELGDLDYLGKLEIELEKTSSKFVELGISDVSPQEVLIEDFLNFTKVSMRLDSIVNSHEKRISIEDYTIDAKEVESILSRSWKTFEKEFSEFEKDLNEQTGLARGIPLQISDYDAYRNNQGTQLGPNSRLANYINTKTSYKNDKLKELHSLLKTLKFEFPLKKKAEEAWEAGKVSEAKGLVEKITTESLAGKLKIAIKTFEECKPKIEELKIFINSDNAKRLSASECQTKLEIVANLKKEIQQFPIHVRASLNLDSEEKNLKKISNRSLQVTKKETIGIILVLSYFPVFIISGPFTWGVLISIILHATGSYLLYFWSNKWRKTSIKVKRQRQILKYVSLFLTALTIAATLFGSLPGSLIMYTVNLSFGVFYFLHTQNSEICSEN
jgi:hypothetical protein